MAKDFRHLNLFLIKESFSAEPFSQHLSDQADVSEFPLVEESGIVGQLFVKNSIERRPNWADTLDSVVGKKIENIGNRSSSAVLFLKGDAGVYALVFGYGRYLLDQTRCVQDFGIKTALNTLDHRTLRSVDLHTLEEQPVQKKAQAPRDAEVGVFGIDILRDILRAVTGQAKKGVSLSQITGGDAMFSCSVNVPSNLLAALCDRIQLYYRESTYKENFAWVDNVQRIRDEGEIGRLDDLLCKAIAARSKDIVITVPEVISWDEVDGFSFTRAKNDIQPTVEAERYFNTLGEVSIDRLNSDRVFVSRAGANHDISFPVYRCVYWEIVETDGVRLLFDGKWYKVNRDFSSRINESLDDIEISDIDFPGVFVWDDAGSAKIESEGDYNERVAKSESFHLLDKKLIKTNRTTTSIELCDLLTPKRQFIHAKHRKGGSAGLSHLFAQGTVSAEVTVGDRAFRKKARTELNKISAAARDLLP
ncbi:DUF6119 family protein [Roseateles chitinivorans]|uniref:DUF6119 family protein n=1 Tax=Roseateles chitinivorans TaxID=2917965 RepID=UPI003D675DBB